MAVRLVVAVTDKDWFDYLRSKEDLTEVNFWAPGAAPFKALERDELFLFKLHSPLNFIVGGGFFTYANAIPCSLAWEAFQDANGAVSLVEMRRRIAKYRRADPNDRSDFVIGCRILTQPFFLPEAEWIPVPASWSPNIVTFKTYDTSDADGAMLWEAIQNRGLVASYPPGATERPQERYGNPILVRPRLGQGAFRVMVTDAYNRRCAVTGERTLPALEAAHIRPFAEGGSHDPVNGLLLRRDIHALFDNGYVTVTPDLRFHVSRRIKEEFENGRHYYALDGQLIASAAVPSWSPDVSGLKWHNSERFRG
ncbi:MAG TPA: HNH endonuclease [Pseudolabrys sp.]|nr:HNH endonuclease [Pseudolabrys sp.]